MCVLSNDLPRSVLFVSTMTTNHSTMGIEATTETSYTLNIRQTMDKCQQNCGVLNLLQTQNLTNLYMNILWNRAQMQWYSDGRRHTERSGADLEFAVRKRNPETVRPAVKSVVTILPMVW
jgi:hypothetical protein